MSDDQHPGGQKISTARSHGSEERFLSSGPASLEELRQMESHEADVTHVNPTITLDSVTRYLARFHSCSHAEGKTEYKATNPQPQVQAEIQSLVKSCQSQSNLASP